MIQDKELDELLTTFQPAEASECHRHRPRLPQGRGREGTQESSMGFRNWHCSGLDSGYHRSYPTLTFGAARILRTFAFYTHLFRVYSIRHDVFLCHIHHLRHHRIHEPKRRYGSTYSGKTEKLRNKNKWRKMYDNGYRLKVNG